MAGKRVKVPDAWDDDDWETKADRAATTAPEPDEVATVPLSKAERLAQHAESNRRLWESAETPPEPFHFLAARPEPPLTTEFKPAVKVLSRKPTPQVISRRDPLTGAVSQLRLDDGDSDEEKNKPQLTPEEVRAKQQREHDEKQRRYHEVRAKIFGTAPPASGSTPTNASNPSSGTSTPGNATPPRSTEGRGSRGRGRGRGGGGGYRNPDNRPDSGSNHRPGSSQSTPSATPSGRELFDPNYSPRPGSYMDRRGGGTPVTGRSTPRDDDQVIRPPKGPESNSRGFARRGARAS